MSLLTDKEKAFCEIYVWFSNFDIETAMRMAGYTYATRRDFVAAGRKLLKNQHIHNHIALLVEERNGALTMDKFYVIEKLKREFIENDKVGESNKLRALELLGKHMDMWSEKKVVNPVQTEADHVKQSFEKRFTVVNNEAHS